MVGLEVFKQAQGEVLFGGILGLGGRFGRALGFGRLLLLERFFPPIPGTEFRIRLIEDKATGMEIFGVTNKRKTRVWPRDSPHLLCRAVYRDRRASWPLLTSRYPCRDQAPREPGRGPPGDQEAPGSRRTPGQSRHEKPRQRAGRARRGRAGATQGQPGARGGQAERRRRG